MIFTRKPLCWGLLFIKVAGLQASNCIKKGLQHRCFLMNIEKVIRTPIQKKNKKTKKRTPIWSTRSSHQRCSVRKGVLEAEVCNFMKKETLSQVFSCEFCEISKNTFLQKTSGRLLLKKIYEQLLLHYWKLFCKNILHILT